MFNLYLALKELKHDVLRFTMIGIILVLISWLVFILSGLGNGLSTLAGASFKNMEADYVVYEKGSQNSMTKSLFSSQLTDELNKFSEVKDAAPMGHSMATVLKSDTAAKEEKTDIALLAVEPGSFLEPEAIEGHGISNKHQDEVLVNDSFKDEGFKLGDTLELEGTKEKLKIFGFTENQTYNHVASVFITFDKWRSIAFAAPGSDNGVKDPVNAIILQGDNIDADAINKKLTDYETVTKSEAINGLPGYVEENGTIMMMLAFLLAISAFVLGVFFYVLTLQKSNQFGIMKAIGASNGFLGRAIVSQVFILSLISILVGILLTYGTALILPDGMPFKLDMKLVVIYGLILLLISIVASYVSVRKITKIDPLQASGRAEE